MQFLTDTDISLTIDSENLTEIIGNSTYLLDEYELIALEDVKDYLRKTYDIEHELRPYIEYSTSGNYSEGQRLLINETVKVYTSEGLQADDRNHSLRQIVIDIFKFHMFQRLAPRQINQQVIDSFNRAIDKLEQASKGKIQMNLKLYLDINDAPINKSAFRSGVSALNKRWKY